jgi:hypothetical protein
MNRLEIFERLGLRPGGILLNGFEFAYWGKTLIIFGVYNAWEENLLFRLIFENCTDIQWQPYADDISQSDKQCDVIGILFGTSQSLETCIITTDLFEVVVSYSQLTIVKDWESQN